jgi:hypothetical protein
MGLDGQEGVYPPQSEMLSADPLLPWIDEHFLRNDPYAFKDVGFRSVRSLVSHELNVDANGIFCIGSGAVGLSVNPGKVIDGDLKTFNETSDIDLALISEVHFETAWRDLRRATQPTIEVIDERLTKALEWQRKRLFDGAIVATKVLPFLSFGAEWTTALIRVEEHVARLLQREVSLGYWIYRDYWSLRNYVATGVVKARKMAGVR